MVMEGDHENSSESNIMVAHKMVLLALGVAMATGACKSEKRKAYEALARTINPLLVDATPTLGALRGIAGNSPADRRRVIELCVSADDALRGLRDVRDIDELVRPAFDDDVPTPSEVAAWLLDHRNTYCRSAAESDHLLSMCSDWCREDWGMLGVAAEHLRVRAEQEGVEIVPVPQSDSPPPRPGARKL